MSGHTEFVEVEVDDYIVEVETESSDGELTFVVLTIVDDDDNAIPETDRGAWIVNHRDEIEDKIFDTLATWTSVDREDRDARRAESELFFQWIVPVFGHGGLDDLRKIFHRAKLGRRRLRGRLHAVELAARRAFWIFHL